LFDKGIVASHLLTQKKSLEKQFLEILSEADSSKSKVQSLKSKV